MLRFIAALVLSLVSLGVAAEERITLFHVALEVEADADIIITETIEVVAEGDQIRRGIFRDFPTRYRTEGGLNYYTGFDIISVTRDGRAEPYRLERQPDFTRLYVGDADVFLPDGRHRYEIRFLTDNQIGFFESHDELYFNMIGTGWNFRIERASGEIVLPEGARVGEAAAFVGSQGGRGGEYRVNVQGNVVRFDITRSLARNEGFAALVTWQKGIVSPPGSTQWRDNAGTYLGLLGLAGLILYYYRLWNREGRDPLKGLVIPLFRPPHGLSPVALGYIHERGFRGRMTGGHPFAIAITSLAIKGYLSIEQAGSTRFILKRSNKAVADLPPGERALLASLFSGTGDEVSISRTYDPAIAAAQKALSGAVEREYSTDYFRHNRGIWASGLALGILVALLTAILNVPFGVASVIAAMMAVFVTAATAGVYFGLRAFLLSWKGGMSLGLVFKLFIGLFITAGAALPATIFLFAAIDILSWPAVAVILATALTVCIFFWLLEAPTVRGRKVMDEIEGYMLFLSTTEWDRMKLIGGPERIDAATFEAHLPYSMALGVDKEWARAFAASAMAAGMAPETYQPQWYHGAGRFSDTSRLASTLSSGLASTVSAASSPPSSSSGSGGGGSSGGGGGGGGGGGW